MGRRLGGIVGVALAVAVLACGGSTVEELPGATMRGGADRAAPDVALNPTPISRATICASVVFPNPGGPDRRT